MWVCISDTNNIWFPPKKKKTQQNCKCDLPLLFELPRNNEKKEGFFKVTSTASPLFAQAIWYLSNDVLYKQKHNAFMLLLLLLLLLVLLLLLLPSMLILLLLLMLMLLLCLFVCVWVYFFFFASFFMLLGTNVNGYACKYASMCCELVHTQFSNTSFQY